jgi:amino acid adenylation domain-containing protein
MDHIISDGTSLEIMWRELGALYRAAPLPPPRQFADSVALQDAWMKTPAFARQLAWWKEHLGSVSAGELPEDRPRPPVKSYRGGFTRAPIPGALVGPLRALAARENVSLFTTLLAVLEALIARYTGQADTLVAIPIAGRQRFGMDDAFGFFANMVVLRTDVADACSFRELLQRVNKELMNAVFRQDIPFEKVVEVVRPERSTAHDPLARVCLSFLHAAGARLDLPGVEATFSEVPNGGAKFDLHVTITEHEDHLGCIAEYNADIFDPETVERMLGHYRQLLAAALDEPACAVGRLPLLTEEERRKIVVTWNDTARPLPDVAGAHELFERQVDAAPDRTALVFRGRALSYAELERRANQLAHHLAATDVAARALVGIFLERSADMVVALLAALKVGAVYVPIDPGYPAERVAMMIDDSKLSAVITTERLLDRLPAGVRAVALDRDASPIEARPTSRLASPFPHTPRPTDAPCYVIYTSGSTGKPKGVVVHHRALVNLVSSMQRRPGLAAEDTVLAVTTLSFDVAGADYWFPLSVGARVVIASAEDVGDGEALRRLLETFGVTVMQGTPSTWRLLIGAGWQGSRPFKVLCAGEAFPPPLAAQLLERASAVWNLYGPTETTIYSTGVELRREDPRITIGRPIDNTTVYVLDPHGQPVPPGVLGELVIGGTGVSHGYLERPELTESRFVRDPFFASPASPDARMYKTGDVAAFRSDGEIVYHRRLDHQVKVRGYRIELGEIESVLAEHEALGQVVVIVREDRAGDARLVAYFVPRASHAAPATTDLREHLRKRLPDYMLPQHFVGLASLPLTPAGKIDRKALPAPQGDARPGGESRAPTSPSEILVAKIWADVLGQSRIGATDNFFDLGGHSLLSMMVVARIRSETGTRLSPRDLLDASLEQVAAKLSGRAAPQPIVKALLSPASDGVLRAPASFGQRRLFYLDQLDPGRPVYNVTVAFWLRGEVDPQLLRRSIDAIVERHAVLRTTLELAPNGLFQRIAPTLRSELEEIRLEDRADRAGAAALSTCREVFAERAARPFHLSNGPLYRVTWIRVGPEQSAVLLSFHHTVVDGWSLDVFEDELLTVYDAASRGETPELPSLPIQYADYAAWQERGEDDPTHQEHLAYWKEALHAPIPVLELPFAKARPELTTVGDAESIVVPREVLESLEALGRREGATVFMVLIAGYATLLHRLSGQEEVVIGTPIANRSHVETLDLIGYFANTLALRVRLDGTPTFRELVRRVREVCTSAYAHQETPFEELVQILDVERDISRTPIYQTLFSFEERTPARRSDAARRARDLRLERREYVYAKVARTDLAVWANASPDGLRVTLEYSTGIFEAEAVRSILRQLEVLLQAIAGDAGATVDRLPLLSKAEREKILVAWNDTTRPLPDIPAAHALFERQVDAAPDRTAVVFRDRALSYAELERRANQLAHHFVAMDVSPRSLVGVFLERSADMVVALLAVLKAGATYVPIDPEYPAERIAMMIEDSKLSAVVTTERLLDRLPSSVRAVAMDRDASAIAARPTTRLPSPFSHSAGAAPTDAPCYVIYTSGSTGKPKGVVVHHRALVNFLASMARRPGLAAEDTLLAVTTLSFDIAGLELWLPLSVGARIVVASADDTGDGQALRRLIEQSDITVMQATPSTWRLLIGAGWEGVKSPATRSFKALCGGEAFPSPLASQLLERASAVWNMYGPTETTIWSTCVELSREDPRITIGCPIDNTSIYVLDAHGEPVPPGVPGELVIGGTGVSHGYLHRPDLTEARFVRDPFFASPASPASQGARMYKTGDLASWREDGRLVYHRRLDHQVKVRGYRIELGEIECVLAEHPAIAETVVIVREDRPGDARLVAYWVPRAGNTPPEAADFRAHLRKRLPEYMLPQHFVELAALPLTPAGKVDRKPAALPAPEGAAPTARSRAPSSANEIYLAKVWADVLGHDRVGASDNFFDLGGHSLLSMIVVARVRSETGASLSPRAFLVSSLEQIAAELPTAAAPQRIPRAALTPKASGALEAPASFGQRRLFYLDQLDPGKPVYNLNVVLWLRGPLEVDLVRRALDAIVERHAALRTTLRLDAGGLVQCVAPKMSVDLEVVRLDQDPTPSDARDSRCQDLLAERAGRSFNLTAGPLFAVTLIRVDVDQHGLLVCFHHVVTDGWSLVVFENEFLSTYDALARDRAPALPSLPIQYADYAVWQTEGATSAEHEGGLQYWKEKLHGPLPVLELPFAKTRPQLSTAGDTESAVMPLDLALSLGALARREGVTLFMVMVAAYATLLARFSGHDDVVIGTPIANRTRSETFDLIGYFANTLALRVGLAGAPTFRELLRRVREVCTDAYEHQDTPFEELVQVLHIERDLSRTPIYQTLFSLEEATEPRADEAAALRLERRQFVLPKIARTDLSVWATTSPSGLHVTMEYSTAIFDAEAIRSLLEHFEVLLRAVARDAGTSIDRIRLLSSDERRKILLEWNATARPLPTVGAAHELFERQVDAGPDRTALVFQERSISYAELERQANQLAHHLVATDVVPRALVGVFLERSAEMVVALLAVLKAGATYVPIDPEYPAERIAMMIEDSKLSAVLTTDRLLARLPGNVRAVALDRDAEAIATRPTSRLASPFPHTPGEPPTDAPCYVIYTSGSTGKPKGVVVHHRALVNFLASMGHRPGLDPDDTLLAVTTLSFDIAGLELHLPLSVGARVVIASAGETADGGALRHLLERWGVTVMQATPSTWRLLLGAGWQGVKSPATRSFKALCGGEAFPPPLAAQLLEHATAVWNMYGPTETTIWSTCVELSREDPRITIGRPIDNTSVYILDAHGEPVPPGVLGELVIGGTGVAHGYLDRPELTEARFVHDHFSASQGARMYRTGDLATFRSDGRIVYHRRLDHQVKVRGYRIELGEIEAVLAEHEALAESVVIVREDRAGDARLVAYYVPRAGRTALTATDLRKHLRKRLPEYMLPQHFMDLASLPLTPAGKIDRKALPAPQGAARAAEARAPSTPNELLLSKIWAEVLGHDRIGAADNFFDLGGHSLLSMIVVTRIRSETGASISPRDLLLSSLEQLATQLPVAPAAAPTPPPRPPAAKKDEKKHLGLVGRLRNKLFR